MSIPFTDTQVKDLSLTTLQLPLIIDNPAEGTGLVQKKAGIQVEKDNQFDLDQQNKIFTDHWIGVLVSYYTERERLNKDVNTLYAESFIQSGGKILPPHYDATIWANLVPKLIDDLIGLPVSVSGTPSEDERIIAVDDAIDKLINGFTSGALDTTLDTAYTIGSGVISINSGTLNPGDFIIIDSGSDSMYALVGASGGFCTPTATPDTEAQCAIELGVWTATINITPLSTDKNFSGGARVRNFHAGFTNAERGHQGAPNYAFDVMEHFEGVINTESVSWRTNLNTQKIAVEGNEDTIPANIITIDAAVVDLTAVILDIDTWTPLVIIDVNGKFTDTQITLLSDNTTLRTTQRATRIAQIITSLGPLTQAPDGTMAGSGVYAKLYEFVSIRIAQSGGTLTGFNSADLGVKHFDTKIDNAQNQLNEYNNNFAISLIIADTVVSQVDFEVESVAEFSIGQTIKIMDNDSIVFTRNIDNIVGPVITLDSGITAVLTIGSVARVVRVK